MSRSYKHTPYSGERQNKEDKQIANRKIRRQKIDYDDENYEISQHKHYKKKNNSYDIRDWGFPCVTFEEFKQLRLSGWERYSKDKGIPRPTEEELAKEYDKFYRRK